MDMTATAALLTALSATSKGLMERSYVCSDGIRLAAQHWKKTEVIEAPKERILCLHGWLDNCRSFHCVAPQLLQKLSSPSEIVALDFPGHGKSSHKSADSFQLLADYAFYVSEYVSSLEWESFTLVGHSMGAGVGVMYAACFPEQVEELVLLDGLGPLPRKASSTAKYARKAIEHRSKGNKTMFPQFQDSGGEWSGTRIYPSLEKAVETRVRTAKYSPGNQYISHTAALEMVQRATVEKTNGGVQFQHDSRLQWPSLQYLTMEQVEGLYDDLTCPVHVLNAEDGWPMDESVRKRVEMLLKPKNWITLPGSHHFHADPETSTAVTDAIVSCLK
mmetsp:Transcript_9002/g.13847  ORF Transcript_9002/g.13847 Transcript_9002/m.13847 type:complete len:332 (-) Transcript_9002:151-1146(-)